MIPHARLGKAVIATDQGFGVSEFLWHRLRFNSSLEARKLPLHVDNRATADRAAVGGVHVLIVTTVMDAVAAAHKYDGLRRGKHIFATNGTVAVGGALDAAMSVADGDGHANAAGL